MKRITMAWSTVYGDGLVGAKRFIPATPWIQASSVKRLKAVWELVSAMTNLNVAFAYQTANVENAPDTPVEVGTGAAGMNYGAVTDVSANTNGKLLVRFGWNAWNGSAAVLVLGRCGGSVDYDDC